MKFMQAFRAASQNQQGIARHVNAVLLALAAGSALFSENSVAQTSMPPINVVGNPWGGGSWGGGGGNWGNWDTDACGSSGCNSGGSYGMFAVAPHGGHQNTTTCGADEFTRMLSANGDIRNLDTMQYAQNQTHLYVGQAVEVTYSDGGSEVWMVTHWSHSLMIHAVPKPDSHYCN